MRKTPVKIEWLTKSPAMQSYIENVQDIQYTGGTLYEIDAIESIKREYSISVNSNYIKKENTIKYFLKKHKRTIQADICVSDPYVLAFNKLDYKKYNIAIIHHIDESLAKSSFLGKLFLNQLLKNLKKVDLVVVVSKFWESYLRTYGIQNIKIIYNSYALLDFTFEDQDAISLKERLKLDPKKPTIYLGKHTQGKGVDEILKHIDCSKFNLIASGKGAAQNDKYQSVFLSKKEFPMLLKIADVVLAMSTMPEGWNRIAHEAMLVKTPVIGSGSGGMRELLENSGQKIVTDFSNLKNEIDNVIENKWELGNLAFDYVKKFDESYFQSEWLGLIKQIEQKI